MISFALYRRALTINITKPFYNPEVVARVKISAAQGWKTWRYRAIRVSKGSGLVIDLLSQEVTINQPEIALTPQRVRRAGDFGEACSGHRFGTRKLR